MDRLLAALAAEGDPLAAELLDSAARGAPPLPPPVSPLGSLHFTEDRLEGLDALSTPASSRGPSVRRRVSLATTATALTGQSLDFSLPVDQSPVASLARSAAPSGPASPSLAVPSLGASDAMDDSSDGDGDGGQGVTEAPAQPALRVVCEGLPTPDVLPQRSGRQDEHDHRLATLWARYQARGLRYRAFLCLLARLSPGDTGPALLDADAASAVLDADSQPEPSQRAVARPGLRSAVLNVLRTVAEDATVWTCGPARRDCPSATGVDLLVEAAEFPADAGQHHTYLSSIADALAQAPQVPCGRVEMEIDAAAHCIRAPGLSIWVFPPQAAAFALLFHTGPDDYVAALYQLSRCRGRPLPGPETRFLPDNGTAPASEEQVYSDWLEVPFVPPEERCLPRALEVG